jgi:hypothetical protein
MFLELSGGLAGPDGMAIGADGSLVVVHAGFGTVWFSTLWASPLRGFVPALACARQTSPSAGPTTRVSSLPRQSMESSCMPAWTSPVGRCIHTSEQAELNDVSTVKEIRRDHA